MLCRRNHCAHFELRSRLSALLNQGLEHSWWDNCVWNSSQNHHFKGVLGSCIRILRKCGSVFSWGSWILIAKGPNRTVAFNTRYLCGIQTSLRSSQTSMLACFQVAIIFQVSFVSHCKFYFHSQSKDEHFGKIWAKNPCSSNFELWECEMNAFVLLSTNYSAVGFLLVWTNNSKLELLQTSEISLQC